MSKADKMQNCCHLSVTSRHMFVIIVNFVITQYTKSSHCCVCNKCLCQAPNAFMLWTEPFTLQVWSFAEWTVSCCAPTTEHVSMTCVSVSCHSRVLTAQKRSVSFRTCEIYKLQTFYNVKRGLLHWNQRTQPFSFYNVHISGIVT